MQASSPTKELKEDAGLPSRRKSSAQAAARVQPVLAAKARQQDTDRRAALLDAQTELDFRELAKQVSAVAIWGPCLCAARAMCMHELIR